jgi:hypothetical protein
MSACPEMGTAYSPTRQSVASRLPLALELFFDQALQYSVVMGKLCHHGFVFGELLLKLFDPFEL